MPQKIVIIGGGFAGLKLARGLDRGQWDVTLLDQHNYHQFQPLMYQVATARLEPSSIAFPLRKIFQRRSDMHVRSCRVEAVVPERKLVRTSAGDFPYDVLVIATGTTTNFFGNKEIAQHAWPMKSVPEAIALRNRILSCFEQAVTVPQAERAAVLSIVVAGGGPTGVELAGSLIEMKKNVLPKDYPDMDFSGMEIYLVEGGAHTLAAMSGKAQRVSQRYLEEMGVQVRLNAIVSGFDGKTVQFKDGSSIACCNLIWAAGVAGNVPAGIAADKVVKGNRIQVDELMQVPGLPGVFAIGDVSYMPTEEWPKGHPQLANVAQHQAAALARNLNRSLRGRNPAPFRYRNPGTMATVGKRKAVVDLPFGTYTGFFAWLTWMFLHLMLILNIKNRIFIFINWAISYLTNDTTLRLILKPDAAPEAVPGTQPLPVAAPNVPGATTPAVPGAAMPGPAAVAPVPSALPPSPSSQIAQSLQAAGNTREGQAN